MKTMKNTNEMNEEQTAQAEKDELQKLVNQSSKETQKDRKYAELSNYKDVPIPSAENNYGRDFWNAEKKITDVSEIQVKHPPVQIMQKKSRTVAHKNFDEEQIEGHRKNETEGHQINETEMDLLNELEVADDDSHYDEKIDLSSDDLTSPISPINLFISEFSLRSIRADFAYGVQNINPQRITRTGTLGVSRRKGCGAETGDLDELYFDRVDHETAQKLNRWMHNVIDGDNPKGLVKSEQTQQKTEKTHQKTEQTQPKNVQTQQKTVQVDQPVKQTKPVMTDRTENSYCEVREISQQESTVNDKQVERSGLSLDSDATLYRERLTGWTNNSLLRSDLAEVEKSILKLTEGLPGAENLTFTQEEIAESNCVYQKQDGTWTWIYIDQAGKLCKHTLRAKGFQEVDQELAGVKKMVRHFNCNQSTISRTLTSVIEKITAAQNGRSAIFNTEDLHCW